MRAHVREVGAAGLARPPGHLPRHCHHASAYVFHKPTGGSCRASEHPPGLTTAASSVASEGLLATAGAKESAPVESDEKPASTVARCAVISVARAKPMDDVPCASDPSPQPAR